MKKKKKDLQVLRLMLLRDGPIAPRPPLLQKREFIDYTTSMITD